MSIRPGRPEPLGATYDGAGVNFAVFSEWASLIELCLYEGKDPLSETRRFALPEVTRHVHHGYVPGLKPGALYGFRAHGPFQPEKGLRFNHHKLLMDPYAKGFFGSVDYKKAVYGHPSGAKDDLKLDEHDSAPGVPRCIVMEDVFDWEGVVPPRLPFSETVLYKVHLKGFTMRHPGVPEELRGTYGGFAHPASIDYLKSLGVTAVELLPVHQAADEGFLREKKLTNYWGYSTLGFFAPDVRYACSGPFNVVNEFKGMVKALHRAGIEVILDVVYNHTCEGNQMGPTLSLKGLDNLAYYRVTAEAPRYYEDFTGTGNSLNVRHPQSVKLMMDSLRYWATEMRVDGFRFDLATTLARDKGGEYDRAAPFLQAVHQDPVLRNVKLIAEPWDAGMGGYQLANFPVDWGEWNGKYRDALRRFWKGDDNVAGEIGYRLTGSSDLYQLSGRSPFASVNFVTCHDGFTLHDLVTYNQKHNEANLEGNRDGTNDNLSWNCGAEGETTDPAVVKLREKQKRNFLACLFLSQGVPMLLAGDEMGRTQGGNNNAYCQDNELSWMDWNLDERRKALLEFSKKLIALKRDEPVLKRRKFFRGKQLWDSELKDLAWFRTDGKEMLKEDWQKPTLRALGFLLGGDAMPPSDLDGQRVVGNSLLVLLNAGAEAASFTVPAISYGTHWQLAVDTAHPVGGDGAKTAAGHKITVEGRSLVVLRRAALPAS